MGKGLDSEHLREIVNLTRNVFLDSSTLLNESIRPFLRNEANSASILTQALHCSLKARQILI